MKILTRENAAILLGCIKSQKYWSKDEFERLLDIYGDDWFMEDGCFKKCEDNEKMKEVLNTLNDCSSRLLHIL